MSACVALLLGAAPTAARAQLMDDWLVRTSATPDALMHGASAVFRNPAMITTSTPRAQRAEGMLMDVRGPDVSGVTGMALAGSYRLDAHTSIAAGYQHLGVDGVAFTEDTPDEGAKIVLGQDLFAGGASLALAHFVVGANGQYLHSSAAFDQPSVVRLGVGLQYALPIRLPILVAANAQSQDTHTSWAAAARIAPKIPLRDWAIAATYGASGSDERIGATQRVTGEASWRDLVTVQGGAVRATEVDGDVTTAIGAISVHVNRYELGFVRESLTNGFGAVHTFRIGMIF